MMRFPPGFYGTRADVLVDIVLTSLVVFLPAMIASYRFVKNKNYRLHRNIQVTITAILLVVVSIFEWDIRSSGGLSAHAAGGRWADTVFLKVSFAIHLFFSGATSVIWLTLIALSLWKFGNPPVPNRFSRFHKPLGRLGMIGMILTAVSGIEIYYLVFC